MCPSIRGAGEAGEERARGRVGNEVREVPGAGVGADHGGPHGFGENFGFYSERSGEPPGYSGNDERNL